MPTQYLNHQISLLPTVQPHTTYIQKLFRPVTEQGEPLVLKHLLEEAGPENFFSTGELIVPNGLLQGTLYPNTSYVICRTQNVLANAAT